MSARRKLATVAVLLAACSFAGGAFAATRDSHVPSAQAFLNDVAKRLNVTPQRLRAALQGALADQLNAAVNAGKLTRAQANAIEQRAGQRGFFPFGLIGPGARPGFPLRHVGPGFVPGLGFRPGGAGVIGAAAKYLGLTSSQLVGELVGGKSLAQIARARGKSTAGLEAAIIAAERTVLGQLRSYGRLTQSQESRLLGNFEARLKALIDRRGPVLSGPPTVPWLGPGSAPRFRGAFARPGARPGPPTLGIPPAPPSGS